LTILNNNDNIREVINDLENENEFDFDDLIAQAFPDIVARDNSDYIVNPKQAFKLIKAYNFIKEIVDEFPEDNVLHPTIVEPKWQRGCLSCELAAFIIDDESKMKTLAKIVENCSCIDIAPMTNGKISIQICIPNVYIEK